MPGQLPPLTVEEAKKYEELMQKSVRNLREEAKRAKLSAGARTKSELAYSMVKEKRPRRRLYDTSEDPPAGPKCEDLNRLDRNSGTPCPPLHGVASHPPELFPPKFSPAQLLAGVGAGVNPFEGGSSKDELTRPGSSHPFGKNRIKEDAEKVVAYVPRVKQLFCDSGEPHRDKLAMADHRRQDYVSLSKNLHPYPHCILNRTPSDFVALPERSRDDEAESRKKLCQPPLYDKCSRYGSSGSAPSNARRGRQEYVIEGPERRSCSTQRLEQSPYDTTPPSAVTYHPSSGFSTPQLSYDRTTALSPIQRCSATSNLSSYPAPSYGRHPSDNSHPTEHSEENRTLPPIREAFPFLSWPDHPEAMSFASSHSPRTQDQRRSLKFPNANSSPPM